MRSPRREKYLFGRCGRNPRPRRSRGIAARPVGGQDDYGLVRSCDRHDSPHFTLRIPTPALWHDDKEAYPPTSSSFLYPCGMLGFLALPLPPTVQQMGSTSMIADHFPNTRHFFFEIWTGCTCVFTCEAEVTGGAYVRLCSGQSSRRRFTTGAFLISEI